MKNLVVVLLLVASFCAKGQQSNQTLLWKITGKGLQKPSYLFGTMHLTDKRIFHFTDSMYAAIANTDGLALELNMNEVVGYFVNKLLDDSKDDKKLKDILSESELNKLKEPLAKKFGKNVNDITTKDIIKEKNKWVNSYLKKGDMPTFIDAYLLNIAKRQGKWLGGIEDVEDQMALIDGGDIKQVLTGDQPNSIETLVQLYIDQDLNGINEMINHYDAQSRDLLLTKRNVKMARRMDSLSALRSMFFAVGAAHLPGDSGVINLLRARGFTVAPVFSDKKIFAKDYHFKEVPVEWTEVTDGQNLYKISMPGVPATVKFYGLIEMKFLLELSDVSGYCSMAVINPSSNTNDILYHRIASRVFKKEKIRAPERIMKEGVAGVEYRDAVDDYQYRMQLFHDGRVTYMAWMYARKDKYLESESANRFFSSMKFIRDTASAGNLYTFTDTLMGITFTSQVKLAYNPELTKQNSKTKGWDMLYYSGQDLQSGSVVMAVSKQVKAGNYIAQDSTVLDDLAGYFAEKYHAEKQWTNVQGCRALHLVGSSGDVYMNVLSFVRGNKNISLMLITKSKKENDQLQELFTSLRLLSFKPSVFEPQYDSLNALSYVAPQPFRLQPSKGGADQRITLYAFDSLAGTSYSVTIDTLNRYAWTANDTALLRSKMKGMLEDGDTILSSRFSVSGSDRSEEVLVHTQGSNVFKRMAVVLHGNMRYNLFSGSDSATLTGAGSGRFFSGFSSHVPVTFDIHKNKGQVLMNDLQSPDSVIRGEAYAALGRQDFAKSDLPMLHAALFRHYKALSGIAGATAVNQRIADIIEKLGDKSSLVYVKQQYPALTGGMEDLRYIALDVLAGLKTKESFEAVATLLTTSPPRIGSYNNLYYSMTDSLELLQAVYPSLTRLIPDTGMGMMITRFATTLYDSNLLNYHDLKRSEKELIQLAEIKLPGYLQDEKKYEIGIYDLLYLLYEIDTPATVAALQQFLDVKNKYIKRKAAMLVLGRDGKVPAAVWDTLAASLSTRTMLYSGLVKQKQELLFPQKYLTQPYFVEAVIYDAATDNEDATYQSQEQISTTVAEVDGKQYKFYLYKVSFTDGGGGDTSTYLGVAGGYDLDGKQPEPIKKVSGIYYGQAYNPSDLSDLFAAFLEQKEKEKSE